MSITRAICTMWIWPASRAFAWTCWVMPVWASTPVAFAPPVPTLRPGLAAPEVAGGAPAGGTCDVTPTALLAPDCDTATPVFPTVACWVPVEDGEFCDGATGGVAGATGVVAEDVDAEGDGVEYAVRVASLVDVAAPGGVAGAGVAGFDPLGPGPAAGTGGVCVT